MEFTSLRAGSLVVSCRQTTPRRCFLRQETRRSVWETFLASGDQRQCSSELLAKVLIVFTISSTPAGTTMGLNDRECGQMGVTMMAGTFGWIMEAPAAAAYAVLPVGVDTITPGGQKGKTLGPFLDDGQCLKWSSAGRRNGFSWACLLTVSLHWSDESSIEVQVHVGQVGGRASVHHHFIQHLHTTWPQLYISRSRRKNRMSKLDMIGLFSF